MEFFCKDFTLVFRVMIDLLFMEELADVLNDVTEPLLSLLDPKEP